MGKWIIGLVMGLAALGGVFLLWKQQQNQTAASNAVQVTELPPPSPAPADTPSAPGATSIPAQNPAASQQANTASAEGVINVDDAWAQPAQESRTGANAYMLFTNMSQTPDSIVSVSSPDSEQAAIQDTVAYANGSATRPAAHADLDPGVPLVFEPGGLHVALVGLKHPVKKGDTLTLIFTFAHAGTLNVKVPVGEQPSLSDGIQP